MVIHLTPPTPAQPSSPAFLPISSRLAHLICFSFPIVLLNTRWYDTLYYFITFIQNKPSQKASPSFIPQSTSTVTLEPRLVTDSDRLHSQLETFPTAADLPQQAEKDNNRHLIDQPSIYIQDTLHLSTRSLIPQRYLDRFNKRRAYTISHTMLFKTVALLALSATTLAHPGKHALHRHHRPWGTGTGGIAAPSGGALAENGTDTGNGNAGAFGAGSSSASAAVITQTVVPLAASTTGAPVANVAAFSDPVAPEAAGTAEVTADAVPTSPVAAENLAASTTCSSTLTSTFTSVNYVTMTISSGTSTVPAGGNIQAFQQSTAATSSPSVAPAGFFQKSSFGGVGTTTAPAYTTFATSVAASSPLASSPPAVSSSTPSSSGPSGGKKGLSYNSAALTSAFANTGMSWAYNWAASPGGTIVSGASYVPMLWGLKSVSTWSSDVASAISSGSTAALSFNEPDLSTQANMDPVTAATNHIKYMNPLSVEVGSPAITNGAGTSPLMGIDWLNAFFTACAGKCKVDFVAFHWYADASLTSYFQQHVNDVIAAAAANGVSKVWLTEFGTTGGDTGSFLQTVLPFLESTPQVEKYAFFMCAAPQTLSGTSLNSVGQVYASA
jgi:hypothetical protein